MHAFILFRFAHCCCLWHGCFWGRHVIHCRTLIVCMCSRVCAFSFFECSFIVMQSECLILFLRFFFYFAQFFYSVRRRPIGSNVIKVARKLQKPYSSNTFRFEQMEVAIKVMAFSNRYIPSIFCVSRLFYDEIIRWHDCYGGAISTMDSIVSAFYTIS